MKWQTVLSTITTFVMLFGIPFSTCDAQTNNRLNTEYVVSAKISNNEHEMRVFINSNQLYFKDNTPQQNCNEGQFSGKEYEASSTQEIKLGDKITFVGLKNKGIRTYIIGQFDFKKVGQETEVVTKNAGHAVLQLQYLGSQKSKYCNILYSIPFIIQ